MKRLVAAGLSAGGALLGWAGWVEPRRLVIRELELALPHWPATLDGLRAGVLSDLHAGVPHAGLGAVRRAVDALNAREPDVHLLLGDYLDASQPFKRRVTPAQVAAELGRLRAPLGTLAVLGNHDWHNAGRRMWTALAGAGITVLEDDAVELRRPPGGGAEMGPERTRILATPGTFWVAGLADLRFRRPNVGRALREVPEDAPVLLLSHDPDMFPGVPRRVSLTLSGHLHGGQIAIPLLRRPLMPSYYGERYARGHIVEHGRHLLVTSGLGTSGLPLRLFAPPEALVLTLRAQRQSYSPSSARIRRRIATEDA